jgi:hypothetical protein
MIIAWIQKYVIYILSGVIAVLLVTAGIQYVRYLHAETKLQRQQITSLQKALDEYAKNTEAARQTIERQQKIEYNLRTIKQQLTNMTSTRLEATDEKVFTDIAWSFNNHGLSPEQCDSKKDMSKTIKACPRNTYWTARDVGAMTYELSRYALGLEESIKCYEEPLE